MPNSNVVTEHERATFRGGRAFMRDMQDGAILNVGPVTDTYGLNVTADHGRGPNRDIVAQPHIPTDPGQPGDKHPQAEAGAARLVSVGIVP